MSPQEVSRSMFGSACVWRFLGNILTQLTDCSFVSLHCRFGLVVLISFALHLYLCPAAALRRERYQRYAAEQRNDVPVDDTPGVVR